MKSPADISPDLHERAQAYQRIAVALACLQDAGRAPSLGMLAQAAGLSEAHFQRLFARWAGISPKRYLQHLAHGRARQALLIGQDLLGASLAAGLSGPGRLHDLIVSCEAATPGEVKSGGAGLTIRWGLAATPFGPALLAQSERGLMRLAFLEDTDAAIAAAWQELRQEWPSARLKQEDATASALARRIFSSYWRPEPVHLFVKGTGFQLQVWQALLRVPEGRLITYGALAQRMGRPSAGRAVGGAVGANPIALLIPCHRVIRAGGGLGEYRWGAARKQALVAAELAWHAAE